VVKEADKKNRKKGKERQSLEIVKIFRDFLRPRLVRPLFIPCCGAPCSVTTPQLLHAEGGFGVSFNCVTKDAAFYTTTSRLVAWLGAFPQERQKLWLTKDDLRDSSSWVSPPLVLGWS
jgi:hypothetical protein